MRHGLYRAVAFSHLLGATVSDGAAGDGCCKIDVACVCAPALPTHAMKR